MILLYRDNLSRNL